MSSAAFRQAAPVPRVPERQVERRAERDEPGPAEAPPDAQARMRTLLDEHFDFIWRSLRRFGLTADHADDAAQQVFVVASRKLDVIRPGSERSFLFGAALRVSSDLRRSAAYRREIAHPDPGADLPGGSRPDELLENHRARAALDAVLDEMDLELRTVLVLYELEEMSSPEIASLLAIPVGTVASRLRRARDDFRARVSRRNAQSARGGGP